MITPLDLADFIRMALPDAEVEVVDTTGTLDHFAVRVVSDAFKGVNLLDQHRMIYRALEAPRADGRIHALELQTASRS
jgi:stress-induced morphogen